MSDVTQHPHRRFNPLTGQWVLVSTGRTQRPWDGQLDSVAPTSLPEFDPECYLCPGNTRAGGVVNPDYPSTFTFTNDFASLQPDTPHAESDGHPLLRAQSASGTCRVICFSPRHDLTLAVMPPEQVAATVDLWAEQVAELSQDHKWVQVFENRGEMMGASNPHPHGQIWAGSEMPTLPALEDSSQEEHYRDTGTKLLIDYVEAELESKERLVVEGADWVALVPYWATWPFETMLLSREPVRHLDELSDASRADLTAVLQRLLRGYDAVFNRSFPYSMGWHGLHRDHWQLHAHFYPPLLQPDRQKFMVGYEMLAEPQRDISAEHAAAQLRDAAGHRS